MKAIVPPLIPLFVSSFNRAEDLATAMEARGYQGGKGRTKIPHSSLAPTRYNSNVWLCLVNHWLICIKNLEKVKKKLCPRYKAIIAYDGTHFHGFQKQPNERTVQEEIEKR